MKSVQFDLYKGVGLSVLLHFLLFSGLGFYTVKSIQSVQTPSTVRVSFVSLPEALPQPAAVPEEVTPPEPVKSIALKKKNPEKTTERKKVEKPKPIQKAKPVTVEKKIVVPQPLVPKQVVPVQTAASTVSPAEAYLSLNLAGITEKIQENLVYPRMARKMGWTGKVLVTFLITSTGKARDIEITATSGRSLLDRAVVAALERISTFPVPKNPVSITVPVSFSLQ